MKFIRIFLLILIICGIFLPRSWSTSPDQQQETVINDFLADLAARRGIDKDQDCFLTFEDLTQLVNLHREDPLVYEFYTYLAKNSNMRQKTSAVEKYYDHILTLVKCCCTTISGGTCCGNATNCPTRSIPGCNCR